MIILDGSIGGGQLLRSALALSTLTGQPFRITNIRSTRPKPGIQPQHLACINALKTLANAKADGDELDSQELLFIPGKINAKTCEIDIGTAGSTTLLLQAILLPCLFADKPHTITLRGGTDVPFSMPYDYLAQVMLPHYRRFADIDITLQRRGYYPKGGGEIRISIRPHIQRNAFALEDFLKLLRHKSFSLLDEGKLVSIKGVCHASQQLSERNVAERCAKEATQHLQSLGVPIDIISEYSATPSTGSGITLWAISSLRDDINPDQPLRIGADALGKPHVPAEDVGKEAAQNLLAELEHHAPVDKHTTDNLVPLMALAPSSIRTSAITDHTRTNITVAEAFLPVKFTIKDTVITTNLPT